LVLSPGARLGPFQIVSALGAGGMGEVYRATDTKLKRQVALKILPVTLAANADRLARFQREAEVLASLNHPNIAHIHGLEDADGVKALVMELVEGDDLSQRVARGPIPLDEALAIAKQIAEALEAAHERGIIHRDLKPANIKVRPDGTVKVLDFGLAKATEPAVVSSLSVSQSPTLTSPAMTEMGMILGTAAYMSPEQAKGRVVDRRADVWAFGVVLYEMLTGKRAFQAEDVSETLAAVLRGEVDWGLLPPALSPARRAFLVQCLQKDPRQRVGDIHDVRLALEGAFDVPRETAARASTVRASARSAMYAWATAGMAVVAAALLGVAYVSRARPEQVVIRTMIAPPNNTSFDFDVTAGPAVISPNGRMVAFTAKSTDGLMQLWVRALDSMDAHSLKGTEGATFPFWSPDSQSLGFYATGRLQRVDLIGGAPIEITRAEFVRGASWGPADTIVYDAAGDHGGSIMAVSSAGGDSRPVTTSDSATTGGSHRSPWMLPDGRHFLYFVGVANQIRVGSLDGGESQTVTDATSNAIYTNGKLLFMREGTLLAQSFDVGRRRVFGTPVAVASGVQMLVGEPRGVFSASEAGTLLYQDGGTDATMSLAWFGRDGTRQTTLGATGSAAGVFLSPDGRFATVGITDAGQHTDLWRLDLSSSQRNRLTFETEPRAVSSFTAWSPDGSHIAYSERRNGKRVLAQKLATGAGQEETLFEAPPDQTNSGLPRVTGWSQDGMSVVYSAQGRIWMLPLAAAGSKASRVAKALVQDPISAQNARLSPNGRWVAYQASLGGRTTPGIFVEAFPGGGLRQQVTDNGALPVWRSDGRELYYVADNVLSAVEVSDASGLLRFGAVRTLMPVMTGRGYSYDVAKDGRILALVSSEQRASRPLTLVQNWLAALKGG
jgi:Tol biopolymer transport system component